MENIKFDSSDEQKLIGKLRKYLPLQAPLKDFVFQNTLLSFQDHKFHLALQSSSQIFGYKNYLSLEEYRKLHASNEINDAILIKLIKETKGNDQLKFWKSNLLDKSYNESSKSRIGLVRSNWKSKFKIDLDSLVHPLLFRIACSYLDQGISIWHFPAGNNGFLSSIKELEKNSYISFFKSERAKKLLFDTDCKLDQLLTILVGRRSLFEQYLFDQQFSHPGWSGIISVIEQNPSTLLDSKKISLEEFIKVELLLEIDALDSQFGEIWSPLSFKIETKPEGIFDPIQSSEYFDVLSIWQDAYEWTYFDQVLAGLKYQEKQLILKKENSFQAFFCIDDRECSIRRHLEVADPNCQTFGTPGHFNVEFYFQPEHSNFHTKVCPAPITPKFLIKEYEKSEKRKKDFHFSDRTNGLLIGWLLTHTLGFWSAIKLFISVFRPAQTASFVTASKHMDPTAHLTIENKNGEISEDGLQIGFTLDEMVQRANALLMSVGLIDHFSTLIYFISHGSSSANNPFYATMDCGACSCRPGSVNARVISYILNHESVRKRLAENGIVIPVETQFVGALHDTARDEVTFFDESILSDVNKKVHDENKLAFDKALDENAKERSRRFMSINTHKSAKKIHKDILTRTVSLFEPRPELDHATTSLCIIGRRELTETIFLDRRAFLNSYNYKVDPDGKYLLGILNAASPVCGGISLNYYFSRVDNQNLGAGTKLPHNVMGLFGVANGTDGDLRPGLPLQMVEVHDAIRLMMIVEHFPDVVLSTIQQNPSTYEWYENEWMKLAVIHPETNELFIFKNGKFESFEPLQKSVEVISDSNLVSKIESSHTNLPIYQLKKD